MQAPQYSYSEHPHAILTSTGQDDAQLGTFSPMKGTHVIWAIDPEGMYKWVLFVMNTWPNLSPLLIYCFFQV